MEKYAHFLIDDVIWVLRDVARQKPESLFDNPFLGMLKQAWERYGVKTQLNLFYRTSSFYGNEEFTLADMPDTYKEEWKAASSWLKLGFHAKEEFPDYPLVNAKYEDVKTLFETVRDHVFRFADENSFTHGVCPHWNAVSEAGVRALYDCGVRIMDVSVGDAVDYNGNPDSLPYGHALRLLNNRQPETRVYSRGGLDASINNSICAYNHLSQMQLEQTRDNLSSIWDSRTGMRFKRFHMSSQTLNLMNLDEVEANLSPLLDNAYIGVCTHEQYFYPEYFSYQPDYAEKIFKMGECLQKAGYMFLYPEEMNM